MIIKHLTFSDLSFYNKTIPMIKEGHTRVEFDNNSMIIQTEVNPFKIDMSAHETPSDWIKILNPETTQITVIEINGQLVAGAITVTHSPKCNMLRNNMGNAVLWDIRVHPKFQNKGYASLLIKNSLQYAKKQNCTQLLIETQDNNPKAIQFYIKHGAKLLDVNTEIYDKDLNETQFIFTISIKMN
mgnify:CR=1 FL=1